ncbi:guanine deaminase [Rouxiella silvae]|uniref:Guanine deaminase n=1 Tax=Rouxiella silvae TaxID=1646373 RepID=A0AA41BXC4_9GAMM|nr:guanine deaminase [Rouxiella silvae]MBF6637453.1 guanine deaminase [Rouxiella silvae]ORJ22084.1 guanine deaminase [Rouxiella silvae]
MSQTITRAIRGNFFDFSQIVGVPSELESQARYIEDGMMFLNSGKIVWLGSREEGERRLAQNLSAVPLDDYRDKLIIPGFVDTHIHYPQTEMIGAYGEQLLEWLSNYTFPTEAQYHDIDYARRMSAFFIEQLLNNGTTTALVFGTVHPQSVDALFTAAAALNMRLIAGKVMMDKNAPESVLETPAQSERDTRTLIERWHNHKRLSYALTPRFVPTSSPQLLEKVRAIKADYPDIYLQTHLSENADEISWVKSLYPEHQRYLDVYHHYNLTGSRCIFAHCLHLHEEEWDCLSDTDSSIAFCPTSNLFLGSGLFNLQTSWQKRVRLGIGTDVGAGTTFNMLQTLSEAYKVGQLQKYRLSAFEAFYHATLGGARALHLDDKIGNFDVGKEADMVVLDPSATALQQLRSGNSKTLAERLFVLMTLGDDRNIYRTLVDGKVVYQRAK